MLNGSKRKETFYNGNMLWDKSWHVLILSSVFGNGSIYFIHQCSIVSVPVAHFVLSKLYFLFRYINIYTSTHSKNTPIHVNILCSLMHAQYSFMISKYIYIHTYIYIYSLMFTANAYTAFQIIAREWIYACSNVM